jgi:hypothetical protein
MPNPGLIFLPIWVKNQNAGSDLIGLPWAGEIKLSTPALLLQTRIKTDAW